MGWSLSRAGRQCGRTAAGLAAEAVLMGCSGATELHVLHEPLCRLVSTWP